MAPSSCPCLIAVSVTLRRGVLQGWGFNLQLGAGGFGCQIVTAQCVPSHKAGPQGLGTPRNHGLFCRWLGAPKICCLATSLQLAGRIRAAGESETWGVRNERHFRGRWSVQHRTCCSRGRAGGAAGRNSCGQSPLCSFLLCPRSLNTPGV